MIVATNCPNCKQKDQPVEVKEQRFELYTKDTDKRIPTCVLHQVCGATWELHYKLAGEENLELDED
jgi:hypothetical protein